MSNQKIIFLKGLPWSWKTTWALDYIEKNPNTERVNKDDIRELLHKWVYSKSNEVEVIDYQANKANEILCSWKDLIVDNTHLAGSHEQYFRDLAKVFKIDFEIKSFEDVEVTECVNRDIKRWASGGRRVWSKVILTMAKQAWLLKPKNEFPIVEMDSSLQDAIIVDLDGTLAKMEWRSPYDESRVGEDSVHWDVATHIECYLVWRFHVIGNMPKFIIVSWRSEGCKEASIKWINDNFIHFDEIYMRWIDDKRKDSQVKYDILLALSKKFNILASFEDRDQVVAMWREAWLRCFQVAPWAF